MIHTDGTIKEYINTIKQISKLFDTINKSIDIIIYVYICMLSRDIFIYIYIYLYIICKVNITLHFLKLYHILT